MIGIAEMVKALEIGLPVANVLRKQPIDHVFSEDQARQERASPRWIAARTSSRTQVRLVFTWVNISVDEKFSISG